MLRSSARRVTACVMVVTLLQGGVVLAAGTAGKFWLGFFQQAEPDSEPEPASPPTEKPARRTRSRDRDVMLERARQLRLASVAPMWGDFFGGLPARARIPLSSLSPPPEWEDRVGPGQQFNLQRGAGVAIRRFKLSEGTSALPMDRWIVNYSFFNDVGPLGDVNRYTLGWEKTFDEGLKSVEIRVPFGSSVRSRQQLGAPPQHGSQIGNMAVTYKSIIAARGNRLTSAGLGIAAPTGQDGLLVNSAGRDLVRVRNRSAHLLPFIGWLGRKNERVSWQAFMQLDIDTQGNPVVVLDADGPKNVGRIRDTTLLFVDVALNYRWIEDREGWIREVHPFIELHYSGTLEAAPSLGFRGVNGFAVDVDSLVPRFDVVNLALGASLVSREGLNIRPAVVIPLQRDFGNRQFDYEVGVQVNIQR